MSEIHDGGCLCGDVRYRVSGTSAFVGICHCASCRRASGAPAVAWAMFPLDAFEVTKGRLAKFASSKGVERGFCAHCGTPISYEADAMPGLVDVTLGSMDEPERLPPTAHIWEKHRLPWLQLADGLERHPELPPR